MDSEVIIVGGGLAAMSAALQLSLNGVKPLVLDVGISGPANDSFASANFYDLRKEKNLFDFMIGKEYQGLHNIYSRSSLPYRLTAPRLSHVLKDSENLTKIKSNNFKPSQSFTKGGLANGWSAGLFEFTDEDLEDFPINNDDLKPYYYRLAGEIGISGENDDLMESFGDVKYIQDGLKLSNKCNYIYQRYKKNSDTFKEKNFSLGRTRMAVLTKSLGSRRACNYNNQEMWDELPWLYSPKYTFDRLISENKINYRINSYVDKWIEKDGCVEVQCKDLKENKKVIFKSKVLILAAGTINTSKITLNSFNDNKTSLPLLDNPAFRIPFFIPNFFGSCLEMKSFGLANLSCLFKINGDTVMGSIIELSSVRRGEFYSVFPFSASSNVNMIKYLLPGMMAMQLFYPASFIKPSLLKLNGNGTLSITGPDYEIPFKDLKPLLKIFRSLGVWTAKPLIKKMPLGSAKHYAGTLPMKRNPQKYQTFEDGRLQGTKNVYVADAACFSSLPCKTSSFTMMANAMRIVDGLKDIKQ